MKISSAFLDTLVLQQIILTREFTNKGINADLYRKLQLILIERKATSCTTSPALLPQSSVVVKPRYFVQ